MFFNVLSPKPPTGTPVMIKVVFELPAIRVQGENESDLVWEGPDASQYQGKVVDWRFIQRHEEAECKAALHQLQGA